MGAFATVKFLSIVFALLAGLSVYLFLTIRLNRRIHVDVMNGLYESRESQRAALQGVILDLREDNRIIRDRLETRTEMMTSAERVFHKHVSQIIRQEETIRDLRARCLALEAARMFALDSTEERINSIRDDLAKVHAMAQQLASKRAHGLPDLSLLEDLAELATTTRQDAKGLRGSLRQIRHQSQG